MTFKTKTVYKVMIRKPCQCVTSEELIHCQWGGENAMPAEIIVDHTIYKCIWTWKSWNSNRFTGFGWTPNGLNYIWPLDRCELLPVGAYSIFMARILYGSRKAHVIRTVVNEFWCHDFFSVSIEIGFKGNRNYFFQFRIEYLLTMRYHGIRIGFWNEKETVSVLLTYFTHILWYFKQIIAKHHLVSHW